MSGRWDILDDAASALREAGAGEPVVGLVLGSGLGAFADGLEDAAEIPFSDVPGMAGSTVPGHAGRFVFGTCRDVRVAVMQGRIHLYEGHGVDRVVTGVCALAGLGVGRMLVTNAAGGIRDDLRPGDFLRLNDHINLTGANPVAGAEPLGETRFVDMSAAYDPGLGAALDAAARSVGVAMATGVYAALPGPTYETPAEVRMLAALGADAVGMSTVPEVLALRALGVRVAGLSLITNRAAGTSPEPLSHEEVEEAGRTAAAALVDLLTAAIPEFTL